MSDPQLAAITAEIKALHIFFSAWFSGRIDKDKAIFDARLTNRMSKTLRLIQPGGETVDISTLRKAVWGGYGGSPDFRIVIRNVEVMPLELPGFALATYEEWQRGAVNSTPPDNGRAASVLFRMDGDKPALWEHIHETWLPENRYTNEAFRF